MGAVFPVGNIISGLLVIDVLFLIIKLSDIVYILFYLFKFSPLERAWVEGYT